MTTRLITLLLAGLLCAPALADPERRVGWFWDTPLNKGPETTGKVSWSYVGMDQLPAALAEARRRKQMLLVGLSGSDT